MCVSTSERKTSNKDQIFVLRYTLDVYLSFSTHESGHCVFGVANLDPCERLSIDPTDVIQPLCMSLLTQCVRDGYDGFVETVNPRMALAMSGTAAAPPYSQEPCGNE
jgi:hypothetical protein